MGLHGQNVGRPKSDSRGGKPPKNRAFGTRLIHHCRFPLCEIALYKARSRRPAIAMTLVSIPANPVPDDTVAGMLKTKDGASLRFARFAPPPGRKGTVCIFQGRAECIEKYFETVRDLRARGFAVAIVDWRGQGGSQRVLSDPFKGHVRDF